MMQIVIKTKKKPNSINIIHSGEIDADLIKSYIPSESFDMDLLNQRNEYYYDESSIKNKRRTKKSTSNYRFYFEEYLSLPHKSIPIQIDLSKVSPGNMTIEEIQDEIQHAYDRGFDDAQQLTRTTFEIELQKRQFWILNFEQIVNELRAKYSKEVKQLEETVLPMSVMIAQLILNHEVSTNTEIILEQVKKALSELDNEIIFKIKVHPYDLDTLNNVKHEILTDKTKLDKVIITQDDNVDQGSCILETSVGNIDASFKAQLDKIKNVLSKSSTDHLATS